MIIHRGNCQIDHWMNWLLIGYMGTMIVLFSQFYIKRYLYLPDIISYSIELVLLKKNLRVLNCFLVE